MFAGSMQLLAGVKLCTGRTLTNHPHYEDSSLRERTRAVSPAMLPRCLFPSVTGTQGHTLRCTDRSV